MSKNVAAVLRLHWMDTRYSFAVFWSTLIACEMVLFLLVWFFAGGVVMFSGWLAVYVFALIGGAVTMNSTFPVAVGWSVPRKDVYVATMIHYVLACLALAVIYMIMYSVEKGMMSLLVGGRFHFFTLPGEVEGEPSVWLMLWVHFIVAWTLMAVGHFFGCLYYRFGRFGIFFFIGLSACLMVLLKLFGAWNWIGQLLSVIDSFEEFTLWLVPLNVAVFAAAWLFLRKAPAKKMG